MKFIDSHAHLYEDDFSDDIEDVVLRAQEVGVDKILLPNIDVESILKMKSLYEKYPDYMFPIMGLHPTSVDGRYKENLELIRTELYGQSLPYIAVGEIGLDFYWDTTFKEEQITVLKHQLDWAKELQLPVVIHSRDAYAELYDILSLSEYRDLKGVIHSFTGTSEELMKFLPLSNWLIGINGIVTFKNASLSDVVSKIPIDRLLIETDAPYLSPTPKRGRRNESSFLIHTLLKCAEIYNVTAENMAMQTERNTKKLFDI